MNNTGKYLIDAFSSALKNEKYFMSPHNGEEKIRFFHLAEQHKILPIVTRSLNELSPKDYFYKKAKQETQLQARRTADFLLLYEYLKEKGIKPLVLKGLVCRSLYPYSEERCSSDEDLWIEKNEIENVHKTLLAYGLKQVNPKQDINEEYEVAYEDKDSQLYIEVHKMLFPTATVYSYMNDYFPEVRKNSISETIYNTKIYTLSYTDHLLFLILHSYKHFLHGGFGIRQIADILLFSKKYQKEIDWDRIKKCLKSSRTFELSCAVFKIGLYHLTYDEDLAKILKDWNIKEADEGPLLEDVLESGIYGASTFTRLHTSTITLNALEKNSSVSIIKTVFLPLENMKHKYAYLEKTPYLLPIAWVQRIIKYIHETNTIPKNETKKSIELGKKRVELLKRYKILEDKEN